MYITLSASLEILLPTTLVIANVLAPIFFASLRTANVSAVSPDWLNVTISVLLVTIGFLYLNSDAIATSTGILAKSSIATFPINPALYAVPHAIIYILSILSNSSFVSLKSPKLIFSFNIEL